jgi:alkylation response protein AidB-like acyl-CoA dehydrogenase
LGWGSFGLSVLLAVVCFPFYCGCMTNDDELIETFVRPFCDCTDGSIRGCWAITEPDHGSDVIAVGEECFSSGKMRGNVQAVLDGNEWVINGQKSAWVSGGTIATHAMLHLQIDPSRGFAGNGICILPLDRKGVSRGKPLEKIGQRDLNQGEIYFDEVRIPKEWMIADPDYYVPMLDIILASANLCMSNWSVGLARAAFEEALDYTKQRVQGGKALIEHYTTKQRLFALFARVETGRAISRAAMNLNFNISPPHVEYSLVAKTQNTEMAFQNAHEAIQIFGGNGLTREYLVEKLFRDARATLIEDGNNETLTRHGGHILGETYPRPPLDF